MDRLIVKIRQNKINNQLSITIPKESEYSVGDYVEVIEVKKQNV